MGYKNVGGYLVYEYLDRCVCCHKRIWPWQHGGKIYNSLWHKKCEYASSKGSESTNDYWRTKMSEHKLLPPDECFRMVFPEPYDQYEKRMEGIRAYLIEQWGFNKEMKQCMVEKNCETR